MFDNRESFPVESFEVKKENRELIERLTKEFLKNGGEIKILKARATASIGFYEIITKYKIHEKDLRQKISAGKFAQPLTDNMSRNVRMESKRWLEHDVYLYLKKGRKGWVNE